MDTKRVRVDVKDADAGVVSAVIATYNVKDADGDVTVPGAFTEGASVLISAFGHTSWDGALPVGKGTIKSVGDTAVFEGHFFMATEQGRDTFRVVKETSDIMEWSYGYVPVKSNFGEFEGEKVRFLTELKVPEVSPVMLGAGVGTHTVSAKGVGMKFSEEAAVVLMALDALTDRAADILVMRQEKGKSLGVESSELLEQVDARLKRLRELLEVPDVVGVEEVENTDGDDTAFLYLVRIHQGV